MRGTLSAPKAKRPATQRDPDERTKRTKLACNVPSQTCMMPGNYSDVVADLQSPASQQIAPRNSKNPNPKTAPEDPVATAECAANVRVVDSK